jgi:hypothetical protein
MTATPKRVEKLREGEVIEIKKVKRGDIVYTLAGGEQLRRLCIRPVDLVGEYVHFEREANNVPQMPLPAYDCFRTASAAVQARIKLIDEEVKSLNKVADVLEKHVVNGRAAQLVDQSLAVLADALPDGD